MGTMILHTVTALSDHVQVAAGTAWGLTSDSNTCILAAYIPT